MKRVQVGAGYDSVQAAGNDCLIDPTILILTLILPDSLVDNQLRMDTRRWGRTLALRRRRLSLCAVLDRTETGRDQIPQTNTKPIGYGLVRLHAGLRAQNVS